MYSFWSCGQTQRNRPKYLMYHCGCMVKHKETDTPNYFMNSFGIVAKHKETNRQTQLNYTTAQ